MQAIATKLPKPVKAVLRRLRNRAGALLYYGTGRYCPVCVQSSRRFRRFGLVPRDDAQCPRCGALERHRLVWLFLTRRTDLFDGRPKQMLHVAPEACLAARLKPLLGSRYLTADLSDARAMVSMDIMALPCPDQAFDVIYCSHVLEHVLDDRQAIREFYRTLKCGGWAILLVPITAEQTYENPALTDPDERLRLFGQNDHVRRYGPDYVDRLREAGFAVETVGVDALAQGSDAQRMGLTPASGDIYYCTKRCADEHLPRERADQDQGE